MSNATVSAVVRTVFAMACVAANQKTNAQCRNRRCAGSLYCAETHKRMADVGNAPPEAMPAYIVLFKRKISLSRAKKLMAFGIREEEGTDPAEKLANAIADARRLRRSPNIGAGKHSGCLVIDDPAKEGAGAKKITVLRALMDMGRGYEVTSIHLEPTKDQNPHMRMLIVAASRKTEGIPSVLTDALWELISAIFSGTFDVWVWSNPPKEDTGIGIHTVNLGKIYQKEKPSDPEIVPAGHLRFDDDAPGQWVLEETMAA